MVVLKVAPVFLLALVAVADKKIELQDIEDDNLQSEKQKEYEKTGYQNSGASEYFKNGIFNYFGKPTQTPKMYAVTEAPEPPPIPPVHPSIQSKLEYSQHSSQPQQAMVGYLSNVPMQIYLVPQYYNEVDQGTSAHAAIQYTTGTQYTAPQTQSVVQYPAPETHSVAQYTAPETHSVAQYTAPETHSVAQYTAPEAHSVVQYTAPQTHSLGQYTAPKTHSVPQYTAPQATHEVAHVTNYHTPEAVQTQTNYIEVPQYVAPKSKTYLPQYKAPVTYVSYTPPAPTPVPTVAPVLTYQVQYPSAGIAPQSSKGYYQNTHYQDTNAVEEEHEVVEESPKQYTQEVSYSKSPSSDFPRFYSARPPPRQEYHRHSHIQELPHPNPLLLKPHPSHLTHIPKALPMYKPLNKPVYGGHSSPGILAARPSEHFPTFKRRPASLLDSYVPSRLQIEYMKRGYTNDPLQAYEDLSNAQHFSHATAPRHFERGFLPNQMYHTASGGVSFGHYKRSPKLDKVKKN